ncbi:MAG TPA: hypothetical protein DDX84_07280 [Nitrospiraceae bacterium]|nr:hypothetical protein [Nitrospiraceae bacterium]
MPVSFAHPLSYTYSLTDLNATQPAIRAGYSEKTTYSIGSDLINLRYRRP